MILVFTIGLLLAVYAILQITASLHILNNHKHFLLLMHARNHFWKWLGILAVDIVLCIAYSFQIQP